MICCIPLTVTVTPDAENTQVASPYFKTGLLGMAIATLVGDKASSIDHIVQQTTICLK
jgi:hypothetical protein